MLENQIGKRYSEALSGSIDDDSQLGVALKNLKDFARNVIEKFIKQVIGLKGIIVIGTSKILRSFV